MHPLAEARELERAAAAIEYWCTELADRDIDLQDLGRAIAQARARAAGLRKAGCTAPVCAYPECNTTAPCPLQKRVSGIIT